ncbi:hypothetical protein [Geofilum rubicundum]|uniref:hypothetical protein n=1 Tax=Geofilum rubicundum TaxID=472113 RepID=UPI0007840927|nr:hypothetical protein [Geofilum rubicundum]
MIRIKIIHLVLILGVLMGCKRASSHLPVTVPEEFPEAVRISGNPVESMKHFVVDGMKVIDSFVVILDMKKEKPIFVYSAENP